MDEVEKLVKQYNKDNSTEFRKETYSKKEVFFVCKMGKERQFRSKGLRVGQHYSYTGCGAIIRGSKSVAAAKIGQIKVTKVILEHNHPLYPVLWKMEHEDKLKMTRTLLETWQMPMPNQST